MTSAWSAHLSESTFTPTSIAANSWLTYNRSRRVRPLHVAIGAMPLRMCHKSCTSTKCMASNLCRTGMLSTSWLKSPARYRGPSMACRRSMAASTNCTVAARAFGWVGPMGTPYTVTPETHMLWTKVVAATIREELSNLTWPRIRQTAGRMLCNHGDTSPATMKRGTGTQWSWPTRGHTIYTLILLHEAAAWTIVVLVLTNASRQHTIRQHCFGRRDEPCGQGQRDYKCQETIR